MFRRLYGQRGKVDVPAIGALLGEMTSWDLTAILDENEAMVVRDGKAVYRLQVYFSSLIEWMFNDPAIHHRIVIEVGRNTQYRLEQTDDARTVLDGLSLLIEGVQLCPVEP